MGTRLHPLIRSELMGTALDRCGLAPSAGPGGTTLSGDGRLLACYAWIVGLAAHNAVMAALYGAGVRDGALTAIQAWKEILLAVALARVGLDALRERRLPFRVHPVDILALGFGLLVCLYAVLPQSWLEGSADSHAMGWR